MRQMRLQILFFLFVIFTLPLFSQTTGRWCRTAVPCEGPIFTLPSPHLKYQISIHNSEELTVLNNSTNRKFNTIHAILNPSEIAWSPNDSLFFINYSDGGEVGTWSVVAYRIGENKIIEMHLASEPLKKFQKKMKVWCPGETPNIAACGWIDGGEKILIVGEVPPHSSCKEMGKLAAYLIDVRSGKIIHSMDENELKGKWLQILGDRIR